MQFFWRQLKGNSLSLLWLSKKKELLKFVFRQTLWQSGVKVQVQIIFVILI